MLNFKLLQLAVQGPSPGVRAGHAAVNIGNKVSIQKLSEV